MCCAKRALKKSLQILEFQANMECEESLPIQILHEDTYSRVTEDVRNPQQLNDHKYARFSMVTNPLKQVSTMTALGGIRFV